MIEDFLFCQPTLTHTSEVKIVIICKVEFTSLPFYDPPSSTIDRSRSFHRPFRVVTPIVFERKYIFSILEYCSILVIEVFIFLHAIKRVLNFSISKDRQYFFSNWISNTWNRFSAGSLTISVELTSWRKGWIFSDWIRWLGKKNQTKNDRSE